MQSQMQSTYNTLSDTRVTGTSKDGSVEITMLANYTFCDIDFDKKALTDGVKNSNGASEKPGKMFLKNPEGDSRKKPWNCLEAWIYLTR